MPATSSSSTNALALRPNSKPLERMEASSLLHGGMVLPIQLSPRGALSRSSTLTARRPAAQDDLSACSSAWPWSSLGTIK